MHSKKENVNMVEFALVLPLLLIIVFGILEFGRVLFTFSLVTSAAREAARYGAAAGTVNNGVENNQDCNGIRLAAIRVGGLVGLQNNNTDIQITYDDGPDTSLIGSPSSNPCPPGGQGPELKLGNRINVVVTKQYLLILPLVKLGKNFTITSTSRHAILKNLEVK